MPSQGRASGLRVYCMVFLQCRLVFQLLWSFGLPPVHVNTSIHTLEFNANGKFPVPSIPSIPLDSFRYCPSRSSIPLTVLQWSVSFSFGKHLLPFPRLPVPLIKPSIHYFRFSCFNHRHHSKAPHQIKDSGDQWVRYSRQNQQGHRDLLRGHCRIPFRDRDHVCGGECGSLVLAFGFNSCPSLVYSQMYHP